MLSDLHEIFFLKNTSITAKDMHTLQTVHTMTPVHNLEHCVENITSTDSTIHSKEYIVPSIQYIVEYSTVHCTVQYTVQYSTLYTIRSAVGQAVIQQYRLQASSTELGKEYIPLYHS